jgi:predicted nucleic acid-binding protein
VHNGVLVDTCIFVDFLRSKGSKNDTFKELIEQERVVLSPFVRLEILKGVKVDQFKKLNILLNGFVTIPKGFDVIELAEVHMLKARKGGVNFGLIDYFIVLEALKFKLNIFSRDKLMLELARNLGVRTLAD